MEPNVVLITGGARRVGAAICRMLHAPHTAIASNSARSARPSSPRSRGRKLVGSVTVRNGATVVIGLFSQSMTMFFFIGTGKEIKDAAKNDAEARALLTAFRFPFKT